MKVTITNEDAARVAEVRVQDFDKDKIGATTRDTQRIAPGESRSFSNMCRFGGHVARFYSVAQHSVMVSRHVPGPLAIYGLLHDAPEAYVGDMIRPLKEQVPQFGEIEEAVWRAVLQRFDLAHPTSALWQYVKDADNRALITERRDLLPRTNSNNWREDEQGVEPYPDQIRALPPYEARVEFMVRWRELTRGPTP